MAVSELILFFTGKSYIEIHKTRYMNFYRTERSRIGKIKVKLIKLGERFMITIKS